MRLFQCRKCSLSLQCISWVKWYQNCTTFKPYSKEFIKWCKENLYSK